MSCATMTTGNRIDIGDKPTTVVTFTPDAAHPLAVVSAVTATTKDPAGTVAAIPGADVVELSANVWQITWPTVTLAGRWWLRVAATTGLIAVAEVQVIVAPSAFTP